MAAHDDKMIAIYTLADTSQFLTSDNPVIIIDKGNNLKNSEFSEQFNPAHQILITINPTTCIAFIHSDDPRTKFHLYRETKNIIFAQTLNPIQIQSAEKIIFGSERGLKAFFHLYRLV